MSRTTHARKPKTNRPSIASLRAEIAALTKERDALAKVGKLDQAFRFRAETMFRGLRQIVDSDTKDPNILRAIAIDALRSFP